VPLDAFLMRLDLEPLTFEALGNDQNYKEVVKDQNGVTEFRFRYSLRAHAGPYNQADAVAFSRDVATPLLGVLGRPAGDIEAGPPVEVDPARAIVTAFKPADDPAAGGVILRLWETAGKAGPLAISVRSFKRAILTDLLERDIKELKVEGGAVKIDLRPHGFAALRLLP
jgi:alpha-mannosidase